MTGGIDREVARFFAAGGNVSNLGERSFGGIDGEDGDGVVAAVRGVEKFAVGENGDFGGIVAAGEALWERGYFWMLGKFLDLRGRRRLQ